MNKKNILAVILLIIVAASLIVLMPKDDKKKEEKKENKKEEIKEETYTPALYKMCDDDSCIYLLGAIHLGDNRITKLSDVIIDAYKSSDKIVVELDSSSETLTQEDLIAEEGNKLSDILDEETKTKLEDFFNNKLGLPYNKVENYKLYYIPTFIESFIYIETGLSQIGVDGNFVKMAKEDNKEIIELETFEFQMNLLFGYSNEFYIKQINNDIDNYDELIEQAKEMYEAYITGDVDKLKEIIYIDVNAEGVTEEERNYYNALYRDRNIAMANRVEEFLSNNENVFVTVGAAHVIGNGGIIDLLKDKYSIELVK